MPSELVGVAVPVTSDPAGPGVQRAPAAHAVESSLDRLVLVVLPPWLAVLTVQGLVAGQVRAGAVVVAASVLALIGYAVFLGSGPRRRPIHLLGPLVMSAGVLVVMDPAAVDPDGYPLVVNWLAMTCFSIGALLRGRAAVWTCLVVVGGWLTVALARGLVEGSPVAPELYLAVGVFALVDGLAVAVAAAAARKTAAGVDRAAAERALMAAAAARSEAADLELRRLSRVMHDTAVNTLGAVHRWPQRDRDALARRCAADLAILTRAQHREIRHPEDLVASVASRAELLGVDLAVDAGGWGPELDPGVAAVLEGAGWEALNNVVKHSGQHQADLQWSWDGRDGVMVVHDPGRGIPPGRDRHTGGGLDSVARRAAEAGVAVHVDSAAGGGTSVELHWSGAGDRLMGPIPPGAAGAGAGAAPVPEGALEAVLAQAAWRIAAILAGVGAISAIMQPAGPPRWGNVAALVIVAAVAGYSRAIARGALLPAIPGALYAVATLLASVLPGIGAKGCSRAGEWWWGPLAGLAVISAAVLVDRRTTVTLAAVAAYVVGTVMVIGDIGDPGSVCAQDAWSILVFNLAIVVALVLFRRQLESLWAQGQQIHDFLRRDAVGQARSEEAMRVRKEHVDVAQRVAGPILESLASGRADPLDPRIRDEAGRAEGALRALATISAAVPPDQAQALAGLALGAHARGVALHLSLPAQLAAGHRLDPDPTSTVLKEFVAACPAGSIAQLTYLRLGATTQVLGLADLNGFDLPALHRTLDRDPGTWTLDNRNGQVLLESSHATDDLTVDEEPAPGAGAPPHPTGAGLPT